MEIFEMIARREETVAEALVELHAAGASPIQAITALIDGRGMSLAEAKEALHASPAWFAEAHAAENLQDKIIDAVKKGD